VRSTLRMRRGVIVSGLLLPWSASPSTSACKELDVLVGLVVAAEIAFWLLLLSGLATRYALRRPRLGMALLVATPLVDLLLLAATIIDLRRGAAAAPPHALAAVYIGVSVAWGHRMVRWADARFAHRFAGGPPPERPPRTGPRHAARERREWLRSPGPPAPRSSVSASCSSATSTAPRHWSTSPCSGRSCSRSTS
jgi:hypothetical protein